MMHFIAGALVAICAITVTKLARELWRTREDNKHPIDTRDTGAF